MTTRALKVMEDESPGKHELKAQFVELRARGLSYSKWPMEIEGTARRAPALESEFYALVPKLHLGTDL